MKLFYCALRSFICLLSLSFGSHAFAKHSFLKQEDPSTLSNYESVTVSHYNFNWIIDFNIKEISGTVDLTLNDHNSNTLWLDSESLKIEKIWISNSDENKFQSVSWQLEDPYYELGQRLIIPIKKNTRTVRIQYHTTDQTPAIQWLNQNQTDDKINPYMYISNEPIGSRALFPSQDTPSVRTTFDAHIKIDENHKNLLPLMSAIDNPKELSPNGEYNYHMPLTVPSYLIVLAAGNHVYKETGPRTGVYASPSMIDDSVQSFSRMEQMIDSSEKMFGEYRWSKYDLLILPSSFAWGGMENPYLVFVNPTVVAVDKSNESVITHELAHFYFGNLVTNATWKDVWLNEGFTTFAERLILQSFYPDASGDELVLLQSKAEETRVNLSFEEKRNVGKPEETHLYQSYLDSTMHPENAIDTHVYEKGYAFLNNAYQVIGRDKFLQFLRDYNNKFAFQSITTQDFIQYFKKYFHALSAQQWDDINIDEWIYGDFWPTTHKPINGDIFTQLNTITKNFIQTALFDERTKHEVLTWIGSPAGTYKMINVLNTLLVSDTVTADHVLYLENTFHLMQQNAEIQNLFIRLIFRTNSYEIFNKEIYDFLASVGRMKFIVPIYRSFVDFNKEKAKFVFDELKSGYDANAVKSIESAF